jgi:hypothetical protein
VHGGDWNTARRYLEEVVAATLQSGNTQVLRQAVTHLATLNLFENQPTLARERLETLLRTVPSIGEQDVQGVLPVLLEAQLRSGDVSAAEKTGEDLLTRSRRMGYRFTLVDALRAMALVRTYYYFVSYVGDGSV